MEEYPILTKAPITEALIDIQVKLPPGFDGSRLDFHEQIRDEYPKKNELRRFEGKLELKKGKPLSEMSDIKGGFGYHSTDDLFICQARIDGFTLSRLNQYETWEQLRAEGQKLWEIYRQNTEPLVVRVALRYINKILLPMPIKDFADYFAAPPVIPEPLPQGISSFFNRVIIHEPSIKANAIITTSMEPISSVDFVPIILDIDVFSFKPEGFSEDEIWSTLDQIRDFKNKIFYNSITEKLLEALK